MKIFLVFASVAFAAKPASPTTEDLTKLLKMYQELAAEVAAADSQRYVASGPSFCEGRLTTESSVPVSTSNQSNRTTIYFTPYIGNKVSLYSSGNWVVRTFTERSLALSGLTANTNYDVYLYDNAGTVTLDSLVAWSTDTARSTSLATQDGIYVKSGDATRRYVGTIRTTSTTETQDTSTQRFVYSWCNTTTRFLIATDSTDSWTYNVDSWRVANGSASGNRVSYVSGVDANSIYARAMSLITNGTGTLNYYATGIGVDSTTTNSAPLRGSGSSSSILNQVWTQYRGYPGEGFHTIYWLERGHTSTITVYGDNGDSTRYQSGLVVEINA